MKTVTVGAFKDHQIHSIGRLRCCKERGIRGTEVTGEEDALLLAVILFEAAFQIGGADDMTRRLQSNAQAVPC